jgi:hypothetical protein
MAKISEANHLQAAKDQYLRNMYKWIFLLIIATWATSCSRSKRTSETITPPDEYSLPAPKVEKLPKYTRTPIEGPYSIVKGKIVDSMKEPVAFATVALISNGQTRLGCITNENGEFEIKQILKGTYTIQVALVGYLNQTFGPLTLDSALNIEFELIEAQEIEVILLKPIIYLYPPDTTQVHVELDYQGDLIHTYPRYSDHGWDIKACPDGTLYDESGRSYYALYWEGNQKYAAIPATGQLIAGDQSILFLEKSLATLGLTEREANEFIMYWLPQLEKNPYNLIHFATDSYDKEVPLMITPQPDQRIRIMMTMIPLSHPIDFPAQKLESISTKRNGFTIVEWGGQILAPQDIGLLTP